MSRFFPNKSDVFSAVAPFDSASFASYPTLLSSKVAFKTTSVTFRGKKLPLSPITLLSCFYAFLYILFFSSFCNLTLAHCTGSFWVFNLLCLNFFVCVRPKCHFLCMCLSRFVFCERGRVN